MTQKSNNIITNKEAAAKSEQEAKFAIFLKNFETAFKNLASYKGVELDPFNPDLLVGKKGLKIYREMRLDDQIKAVLYIKKLAVVFPSWKIAPGLRRSKLSG